MNFNSLPSIPLRMIFSQLPLNDLFQCGQVCSLWDGYQRELTSKVNTLTLHLGPSRSIAKSSCFIVPNVDKLLNDDGTPYRVPQFGGTVESRLEFITFDQQTVELLLRAFENVHTLEIIIDGLPCQVVKLVLSLLVKWKTKLVTLKLWCHFSCEVKLKPVNIEIILKLFDTINTLSALNHLTFELHHNLYSSHHSVNENFLGVRPHFELSILKRVQEFYFYTGDQIHRTPLFYNLKHYASENARLQQICIGNWDKQLMYSWFAFKCPDIGKRFTLLPGVDWVKDNEDNEEENPLDARRLFSQFSSLTHISFDYIASNYPFSTLINAFSELSQLISLYLRLILVDTVDESRALPLSSEDHKEPNTFAQLFSIKLLSITVFALNHADIEFSHWNWIFPNLQLLYVYHDCFSFCKTLCKHYANWQSLPISIDQRLEDTRQMLSTFKQCNRLRQIATFCNYPFKLSTEWELTEVHGTKLILRAVATI